MATIISFNANRAVDLNGFAVPGALASFYDSGTSRARTVYSDPECTLPHPVPLAADGAGVFPAVYDTGNGDVKVAVTTAAGTMLAGYPMDPARIVSTDNVGAAGVQFSPTEEIPETDVQAALERVQENIVAPLADFGLGVTGNATLLVDIDAIGTASGFYRFDATTAGTFPSGVDKANGGIVLIFRRAATAAVMLLIPATNARVHRRRLATTWQAWTWLMASDDTATDAVWTAGASTVPAVPTPAAIAKAVAGLSIGGGQVWQEFPGRTANTIYQNNTGRAIVVAVTGDPLSASRPMQVAPPTGGSWINVGSFPEASSAIGSVSTVVPDGWRYRVLGDFTVTTWAELR